jgi:hypothetical protein
MVCCHDPVCAARRPRSSHRYEDDGPALAYAEPLPSATAFERDRGRGPNDADVLIVLRTTSNKGEHLV